MERHGRGSLSYTFLAIFATLANVLFTTLLPIPGGGQLRGVVTGIWTVAYFSLAAAALHPGITAFSSIEGGSHREDLSPVRLAYLGAALWVSPMLGVVPVVLHRPADLLLLFVGPLLIIPLVLVRIRQFVAERIRDQRALAYQAAHDELTGLPNRRAFFQLAEDGYGGRSGLPSSTATSTDSNRSTIRSVTGPATRCCGRSPSGCVSAPVPTMWWVASVATNS